MAHFSGMVRCGMDIFTLVKANIRRKKGAFAGIMLFMLIISLSVTSIVSLKRNFENSIASEYDHMNGGNITLKIRRDLLTDDIIDEVNSHPFVRDSMVMDTLVPVSYTLPNGIEGGFSLFISEFTASVDRLWKADLSGFEDNVPPPENGEIYLPQAMSANENIAIGDTVTATFGQQEFGFRVK